MIIKNSVTRIQGFLKLYPKKQTHRFAVDLFFRPSASDVVICVDKVCSLEELVVEYEGTDCEEESYQRPYPVISGAEGICDAASAKLSANTVAVSVIPNDRTDAECDGSDDERHKTVVHCLLAVILGSHHIDLAGENSHHNEGINAECYECEEKHLKKSSFGLKLHYGSVVHKHTSLSKLN